MEEKPPMPEATAFEPSSTIYTVPLANNEGRKTPLFVNATHGPKGVQIYLTGGDFSFRNIVGEERYQRHLELVEGLTGEQGLVQRFLGRIGLRR